ncbi:MAG TPA: RecX family transcriptional regulator [Gaiellaceae bacterium]|nr:RecX family transcriptional regulator [Gaiellaceae bacterium]
MPAQNARTVTALRELPRGKVDVELDGGPWRRMPVDAVVGAGLMVGRTLDRETARTLARELRRSGALARATRALAARDRSRSALDERLAAAGVAAEPRREALETLERAGLVDDARFAAGRAAALAERGHGDASIRFDLERQGLSDELVADALAALEPERERARRLAERRGRGPKTARWLAARGFEPDTVEEVAGEA